ncbi:uncharacterized protein G2W53_022187 [Senna tora]|uniref:BED-type domain-containing protein n=1 Tax=Senna tora TaxID=362788 RepID=A0A834WK88_9FABA|nr:uncharacterized protein G2W53_022187 [Senna tora]
MTRSQDWSGWHKWTVLHRTRAQPGLTRRVLAKPGFVNLATSLAVAYCGARRGHCCVVTLLCRAVVMSISSPNPTQETPESNPNSSSLQTQSNSSRGKSDPAWGHCRFSDETSAKKHLICMYCNKIFKGGGINRIKQHLAGIKGDTESCKKVPADVRFQMHDNVVNFNQRKRKAQEEVRESTLNSQDQEHEVHHNSEEVQDIGSSRGKGKDQGKSTSSGLSSYFMPRTTPGAQPTLKVSYTVRKREKDVVWLFQNRWTHTGGREILRPAPTRFATNFVALQSILAQKDALRAMVTCKEWTTSSFARESKSKKFVDVVLDSAFHKAREEMVKRFQRRKRVIEPYLKIIDRCWDKQLYKNLHATGFWFNPSYHYDTNEM